MDIFIAFIIGILVFLVLVTFTALSLKLEFDLKAKKLERYNNGEISSSENGTADDTETYR